MAVDARHDLPVHLDEPAVRVEREARVARRRSQALDRDVVQAEVQDRVHHPGHRDRCSGADGDEERALRVSEAPPRALLECRNTLLDLAVEALGHAAVGGHVRAARFRRDREPRRDRDPELGHLREADALSAEKLAAAPGILVEVEDVAHLREESTRTRRQSGNPHGYVVVPAVQGREIACRCGTGAARGLSFAIVARPSSCAIVLAVIVYAVVDDALSPDFPLGVELEVLIQREDAELFVQEIRGDDPKLASYLRIEERELEAGGLN